MCFNIGLRQFAAYLQVSLELCLCDPVLVVWVRLHADIMDYLVERGAQGLTVFNWFHRQFKEVVKVLWLSDQKLFEQRSLLIADYFSGRFAEGKIVESGPQKSEVPVDRRINPQSLVISLNETWWQMTTCRSLLEPSHLFVTTADDLKNFHMLSQMQDNGKSLQTRCAALSLSLRSVK